VSVWFICGISARCRFDFTEPKNTENLHHGFEEMPHFWPVPVLTFPYFDQSQYPATTTAPNSPQAQYTEHAESQIRLQYRRRRTSRRPDG
jgi:hypothetical protein